MIVKTVRDCLESLVSGLKRQERATTYSDNPNDNLNEFSGRIPPSTAPKGGCTNVDCGNQLDDNGGGAVVGGAGAELGNESVALVVEGVEGIYDVAGGPLLDDLGDSPGEGHCTGGEDSEDSRETHGEKA